LSSPVAGVSLCARGFPLLSARAIAVAITASSRSDENPALPAKGRMSLALSVAISGGALVLDGSDVGCHLVEPGAGGLGGVVFSGGHPQLVADRVAQDRLARRAPQGVQQLLGGQVLLRQDIEVH